MIEKNINIPIISEVNENPTANINPTIPVDKTRIAYSIHLR